MVQMFASSGYYPKIVVIPPFKTLSALKSELPGSETFLILNFKVQSHFSTM